MTQEGNVLVEYIFSYKSCLFSDESDLEHRISLFVEFLIWGWLYSSLPHILVIVLLPCDVLVVVASVALPRQQPGGKLAL
jgi:hypothetical protein